MSGFRSCVFSLSQCRIGRCGLRGVFMTFCAQDVWTYGERGRSSAHVVQHANRIPVLDNVRSVEEGTHGHAFVTTCLVASV